MNSKLIEARPLRIIAGPCSVDSNNLSEIYQIAGIEVANRRGGTRGKQRAIYGARVVGLKSRTGFNPTGEGMGIDAPVIFQRLHPNGEKISNKQVAPSVEYAQQIVRDTGLLVATEVMMPELQLPDYEGRIPPGKLLAWNPSVAQLGWTIAQIASYAGENGWYVGIKNGKTLGTTLAAANNGEPTSLENCWNGLASYASGAGDNRILIHRGVDVPEKGDFRNALVHETAKRVKRETGLPLYFDPSHSYGPKLRGQIVQGTIEAMLMVDGNDEYLYDGILVEAGTSKTDTKQHITLDELAHIASEVARFRTLEEPDTKEEFEIYRAR